MKNSVHSIYSGVNVIHVFELLLALLIVTILFMVISLREQEEKEGNVGMCHVDTILCALAHECAVGHDQGLLALGVQSTGSQLHTANKVGWPTLAW